MTSNTPYGRGFAAFHLEQPTSSCEHPHGSGQGREWVRGWTDGQIADRLKLNETRPS